MILSIISFILFLVFLVEALEKNEKEKYGQAYIIMAIASFFLMMGFAFMVNGG